MSEDEMASDDCPGCRGGDKVPANADYWRCPVCDAEWFDATPSPQDLRP